MPRPRLPKAKAELTGAAARNPGRYRDRGDLVETAPIGPPPSRFSPSERAAWAEIVDEIPWLTRTDRKVVEVTARLSARMIDDPDVSIAALAQLRMCLGALGATPADRSRIHHSDDQPSDPADQYFN